MEQIVVVVAVAAVVVSLVTALASAALLVAARRTLAVVQREGAAADAIDRLAHVLASRDQAWFWTAEWQAGEREADEDLAAGRGIEFKSEKDMDEFLAGVPLPYVGVR